MPHNSIRSGKDASLPGPQSPRVAVRPCVRSGRWGWGAYAPGSWDPPAPGRSRGRRWPSSPRRPSRRSQAPRSPSRPGEPPSPGLGFCGPHGAVRSSPCGSEGCPSRRTPVLHVPWGRTSCVSQALGRPRPLSPRARVRAALAPGCPGGR